MSLGQCMLTLRQLPGGMAAGRGEEVQHVGQGRVYQCIKCCGLASNGIQHAFKVQIPASLAAGHSCMVFSSE